jgi:hypothetical protein
MEERSDSINNSESAQRHSSTEMEIAVRAYELWQMAGAPQGRDLEFWFIAEGELHAEKQPAPAWEDAAGKQAALKALGV